MDGLRRVPESHVRPFLPQSTDHWGPYRSLSSRESIRVLLHAYDRQVTDVQMVTGPGSTRACCAALRASARRLQYSILNRQHQEAHQISDASIATSWQTVFFIEICPDGHKSSAALLPLTAFTSSVAFKPEQNQPNSVHTALC